MGIKIGIGIKPSTNYVSPYCSQYDTVYSRFINKPSDTDAIIQNTWLKGMVDGGYFAKAEFLDMFSVHTNAGGEGLINWKNPGTFNPAEVGTPAFEAYSGFTGNNGDGSCLRLHFIPSSDGTIIGQDNIMAMIGIGSSNAANIYDFGAGDGTTYFLLSGETGGNTVFYCNTSGTASLAVAPNEIAHFAFGRNEGVGFYYYKNISSNYIGARPSNGFISKELYACGRNNNDVIIGNNRQLRYAFLFSYLTTAEINGIINLTEAYLTNYGKNLI